MLMLSFLVISCKKDDQTDVENNDNSTTTSSEFFIEGKVDGVMVRAEYVCPNTGCDLVTGNYDYDFDWIVMKRTVSATDNKGWDILIEGSDLDNWQLPDTIGPSGYSGEIDLDLSYYVGNGVNGSSYSDNNFIVDNVVLGENSFEMIVTSKANDILEGTFSGELRNGSDTDLRVTITEGKFRVKLLRF